MSLNITHKQGGVCEFERTGIYAEYLLFHVSGTRQNWKIKIGRTPQHGVLKSMGKVVYEYSLDKAFVSTVMLEMMELSQNGGSLNI